jgi:hypothetical protein
MNKHFAIVFELIDAVDSIYRREYTDSREYLATKRILLEKPEFSDQINIFGLSFYEISPEGIWSLTDKRYSEVYPDYLQSMLSTVML